MATTAKGIDLLGGSQSNKGKPRIKEFMSETTNPYAPPNSAVTPESDGFEEAYFFTNSTFKLVLMSVVTFGFYEMYWFYRNWVLIKKRTEREIMPFWRAIFCYLFAYSFFKNVKHAANENNIPGALPTVFWAIAYFALHVSWRFPDPFWGISMFSAMALIPANRLALKVNQQRAPHFENNSRLTKWNWVGIVLGGPIVALAFLDLFVSLILLPEFGFLL